MWYVDDLLGGPEMAEVFPIGVVCPQCGKQLVGARGTDKAPLTDVLSCPEHGEVGRFEDLIQRLSDNANQKVEDAMNEFFKSPNSK
jgi:uncharacterized protein YbaR (Trm112 family)